MELKKLIFFNGYHSNISMFSEQAENFCSLPQIFTTTILIQTNSSQRPLSPSSKPSHNYFNSTTAKDSPGREQLSYICGLRARIECEPFSEHSTRRDRVTNIG